MLRFILAFLSMALFGAGMPSQRQMKLQSYTLVDRSGMEGSSTLTLKFSGKSLSKGAIMVAIFDSFTPFLSDDAVLRERIPVNDIKESTVHFNLPKGRFAVAVFLDLNGNGKLDKNLFQYPTEPYGFSNNAKGTLGPPSFDSASFQLNGDMAMGITLN